MMEKMTRWMTQLFCCHNYIQRTISENNHEETVWLECEWCHKKITFDGVIK